MPFVFPTWAPALFEVGAMFALWPFNSGRSLMILVSGLIADFSWAIERLPGWRYVGIMCWPVQDLVRPIVLLTLTYTLQLFQLLWCDQADMWPGYSTQWKLFLRPPRKDPLTFFLLGWIMRSPKPWVCFVVSEWRNVSETCKYRSITALNLRWLVSDHKCEIKWGFRGTHLQTWYTYHF